MSRRPEGASPTAGALTLRTGDLLTGADVEHVRVTPEGRDGTADPQSALDVAGTVRAQGCKAFTSAMASPSVTSMSVMSCQSRQAMSGTSRRLRVARRFWRMRLRTSTAGSAWGGVDSVGAMLPKAKGARPANKGSIAAQTKTTRRLDQSVKRDTDARMAGGKKGGRK